MLKIVFILAFKAKKKKKGEMKSPDFPFVMVI